MPCSPRSARRPPPCAPPDGRRAAAVRPGREPLDLVRRGALARLDRRGRRCGRRPCRARGLGPPARPGAPADRALRHGRLEPRAARDRRPGRQRPARRARLDRSRRRAGRPGRGLALRDRVEVRLDDRAELLRRCVLGQDGSRRLALRGDHRPRQRARDARARRRLGEGRPRARRRGRTLLGDVGVRARAGRPRRRRRAAARVVGRRDARGLQGRHGAWRGARDRDRRRARSGARQADDPHLARPRVRGPLARAADRRVDRQARYGRAAGRR